MSKKILFLGDSITDGNRYKSKEEAWDLNHQMGHSYAYVINALLGSIYPQKAFQFVNRGISGNRIIDIYARIEEDIIAIKPDVLSILVGVNDGPLEMHHFCATGRRKYGKLYRMMLSEIQERLPKTKLVICEPFIVEVGNLKKEYDMWRDCIEEYAKEAQQIAKEYEAVYVPLQSLFDDGCKVQRAEYWCWDGIHPTENGHGLIAKQWIDCTKYIL